MEELRKKAEEVLETYVKDPYHLTHARMVAKAMEAVAERDGKDPDMYYATGLVHDIDYGDDYDVADHTKISKRVLEEAGFPAEVIHAVQSHAWQLSGVQPETHLDFALVACDEISGLFYAYKLMRPDGFKGMKVSSFKKKFKDKGFAAKVDRDDIMVGVEGLGTDLGEHIQLLIEAFSDFE